MDRRIPLLALALTALLVPAASASDGDVQRWSGEVVLDAPFVVPEGTTLVVEPGTVVRASEFILPRPDGVYPRTGPSGWLVVHGRLLVDGTAADPVLFRAPVELRGSGADGSVVRHAVFDATNWHDCALLASGARYRVESSTFTNDSRSICHAGGEAEVVGNLFLATGFMESWTPREQCAVVDDARVARLQCPEPGGEPGGRDRCWVAANGRELCRGTGGVDAGVHVGGGHALVEGNRFERSWSGVSVARNASATVRGNAFVDNERGMYVDAQVDLHDPGMARGRRVLVEHNLFEAHGDASSPHVYTHLPAGLAIGARVGDHAVGGDIGTIEVRNNTFRGNAVGIRLGGDARDVLIADNALVGNGIGLANEWGTAVLERCTFENRVYDLWLAGGWGQVRLVESTFDPSKVRVEGEAELVWEGGVIRAATFVVLVASSLAVLVALATETGRWLLLKGGLVVAYTRIRRPDLLQHATRERLVARVLREPGLALGDLVAEAGSYGAAVYHLARLERERLVKSVRDGSRRRFYPAGAAPEGSELAPLARSLLALVERRPGLGVADAARELGVSKQLASYHARSLAGRGLLRMEEASGGGRAMFAVKTPPADHPSARGVAEG